ncbi:MAG: histidine--tRNA ligase [Pirellulales bacterium]|nr:histidine--tRNA ligase [Pirellulales bacterium]
MSLITPRTLKGFRDHLPETMLQRERLIDTARGVYRAYGFSPIDTPALEYEEILLGKGSEETDKQVYRFEDHGGRRVGLRFDLTVPLARFAAQHIGDLGTPLKRYQIANVWRGENTQKGRYREFVQCDFDTIGTQSIVADIETALVIHDLLLALGCENFKLHINNRKILTGLIASLEAEEQITSILRILDKLSKVGRDKVEEELLSRQKLTRDQVSTLFQLTEIKGANEKILEEAKTLPSRNSEFETGLAELSELISGLTAAGVPEHRVHLDLSIARGLDYYTGSIFETFLDAMPEIGSVCSGGRYDHLAETYTKKKLPGVGASLGLDRLLAAMQELGSTSGGSTPAEVFIVYFAAEHREEYLKISSQLRRAGLRVELYPEPKKIGQQLKYANRRGHKIAVIAGGDELTQGTCQIKNLDSGAATQVVLDKGCETVIEAIKKDLAM